MKLKVYNSSFTGRTYFSAASASFRNSTNSRLGLPTFSRRVELLSFNDLMFLSNDRHWGQPRCGKCGERFRSAGTLRQHAARHRDDRPFGCAMCERRFKRRPSLAVHLRTHTGERPYTCVICQRAFAQHGDLRKHQRTHREAAPALEPFPLGELGELLLLELPAVEVEVP